MLYYVKKCWTIPLINESSSKNNDCFKKYYTEVNPIIYSNNPITNILLFYSCKTSVFIIFRNPNNY